MSWGITTKQIIAGALLVPLVVLLIAVSLVATTSRADPALDEEETQFLDLINQYRAANCPTCAPLTIEEHLNNAADWMSSDMAANNRYSHEDSLGRHSQQRETDFGFEGTAWGENLACYRETAEDAFTAWMNSPGHNANMLGDFYNAIGIARVLAPSTTCGDPTFPTTFSAYFWTTEFGCTTYPNRPCPPFGTPSPAPATCPPFFCAPPTPTPPPGATVQVNGNVDCDGDVDSVDGLKILRFVAGLDVSQVEPCVDIGAPSVAAAEPTTFGDVDCDIDVDSVDALKTLRYVSGLPVAQWEPCADIGN